MKRQIFSSVNQQFVTLVFGLYFFRKIAISCPGVVRKEFSDVIANHTLVGPVLYSFRLPDEMHCQLECHMSDVCLMYNYNETSGICELLNDRATAFKIVASLSTSFRTQKCENLQCQNGGSCCKIGENNETCLCSFSWKGKFCHEKDFVVQRQVCFGAKDNSFGRFYTSKAGHVRAFKLVHRSGGVSWIEGPYQGNWGTTYPAFSSNNIEVHLTNSLNQRVFPTSDIQVYQSTQLSPIFKAWSNHYYLPGRTNMDPKLVLPDFSPPLSVISGQEFRIWFGQDLLDKGESDNHGTSCADVYVYYTN